MLNYLTTSQTLSTDSALQRLDPRTRLLGFVALLIVLIGAGQIMPTALAVGAILGLLGLARVPLRYGLRGVRLLLPWLVVIALVQVLFGVGNAPGCAALLTWGPLHLTLCSLQFALVTVIRFVGLVLLMSLFTWTTPIPSLVRAVEALARPLARLGLPAHQLALVGVIALRFVPTMALELERLQKAQAARGAGLGSEGAGFLKRVRRTLPLIVPLFVLALERAERLAEAMEARAYAGGRDRGRYVRLRFRPVDGLALAFLVVFTIIVFRL